MLLFQSYHVGSLLQPILSEIHVLYMLIVEAMEGSHEGQSISLQVKTSGNVKKTDQLVLTKTNLMCVFVCFLKVFL